LIYAFYGRTTTHGLPPPRRRRRVLSNLPTILADGLQNTTH
jgi:hypothetical protein